MEGNIMGSTTVPKSATAVLWCECVSTHRNRSPASTTTTCQGVTQA
eukprot:CAMPEP_0118921174 /NCGR_PEP_ID=MMETSP1169-20130426/542_1 /TAXON_ID=36882 /ORGANISM="Pyramimonas obovata, Strain CCMP722" /LENGTH=45 /DNA_ID= /DNA_START= /DNA_END= /DNA_ORIENTATION=